MIFEDHPSPEGIEKLKTSQLHELFMTKLREVYYGEMRLLEVLTLLQEVTFADRLKKIVSEYQRKKGEQVERLQQVFILLDFPISGKTSRVMEVMIEECYHLIKNGKSLSNDFAIGNLIMFLSHQYQAAYQWLSSLTLKLKMKHITVFFEESFALEKEMDIKMIMASY